MAKVLPFDLISYNILQRLPVKSLVRFTSVCKTWESLIKSPQFIATQFKLNNQPESESESESEPDADQYFLILCGKSCYIIQNQISIFLDELGSMSQCFLHNDEYKRPAESCNGLILLKVIKRFKIEYLLWNPTIKKSKTIESINSSKSSYQYQLRGFGFRESSTDYKVVKVEYDLVDGGSYEEKVQIYSLETDSWRKVESKPNGLVGLKGGVFLNGCVHWLATRKYNYNEYKGCTPVYSTIESILFFDFEKECFGEIKLPKRIDCSRDKLVAFKEFRGALAAVFYDFNVVTKCCYVWAMSEYGVTKSWTEIMTIRMPITCGSPLGFTKNGMLVCEAYNEEEIPLQFSRYNTGRKKPTPSLNTRKKVSGLIFLDNEKFELPVKVIDYMESLALLGKDSGDDEEYQ